MKWKKSIDKARAEKEKSVIKWKCKGLQNRAADCDWRRPTDWLYQIADPCGLHEKLSLQWIESPSLDLLSDIVDLFSFPASRTFTAQFIQLWTLLLPPFVLMPPGKSFRHENRCVHVCNWALNICRVVDFCAHFTHFKSRVRDYYYFGRMTYFLVRSSTVQFTELRIDRKRSQGEINWRIDWGERAQSTPFHKFKMSSEKRAEWRESESETLLLVKLARTRSRRRNR